MLYLITGPPAAGKTTYVTQRAQHGDIVVDFDAIARALTPAGHNRDPHVVVTAREARLAASQTAIAYRDLVDVYVILADPSKQLRRYYRSLGGEIMRIDPGMHTVLQRCQLRGERDLQLAREWYAAHNAN